MLDRRKGPDKLVKWVKWSGIVSWLLVAVILFIALIAKPDFESYIDRSFHIRLESKWDENLLSYVFPLLLLLFFFCIISIIINIMRSRRKSDRFNMTLIINAATAFVGIVLYFIYFYL